MRSIVILIASLAIIVLGLWGSAVIFLDEERLKRIVADQMMQQTGRKVEIAGSLRVRLFPRLQLRAERVIVGSPAGFEGPDLMTADHLAVSVRLLPLVRGNISAGQMQVSGATINLHTDSAGRSSLDGLASVAGRAEMLATRELRLEDVTLVISDVSTRRRDTLAIDWIELDRFSLDRAAEFRFRGNIGDPPVFRQMRVDALLYVPSSRDLPVRLANMRLAGDLAGSGVPLTLLGNLNVSAKPPLALSLEEGRLAIGEQELGLTASYAGGDAPQLNLRAQGEHLNWSALAGDGIWPAAERWLPLLRGIDVSAQVDVDRLRLRTVWLENVRGELGVRDGEIELSGVTGLPGGVAEASGRIDARLQPPAGLIEGRIEVADLATVMTTLGLPSVLTGSGVAEATWAIGRDPDDSEPAGVTGEFEFWDGRWAVTGDAFDGGELPYSRLAGRFRLLPDHLDVPELTLDAGDLTVFGWMAVERDAHALGGRLIVSGDGREIELSGTLSAPVLSAPLLLVPEAARRPGGHPGVERITVAR